MKNQPGFRRLSAGRTMAHWFDGNGTAICKTVGKVRQDVPVIPSKDLDINTVCTSCLIDVTKVFGQGNVP
jgi:hypothetical protein